MQLMPELRPSSLRSEVNTNSQTPDDANGEQVNCVTPQPSQNSCDCLASTSPVQVPFSGLGHVRLQLILKVLGGASLAVGHVHVDRGPRSHFPTTSARHVLETGITGARGRHMTLIMWRNMAPERTECCCFAREKKRREKRERKETRKKEERKKERKKERRRYSCLHTMFSFFSAAPPALFCGRRGR